MEVERPKPKQKAKSPEVLARVENFGYNHSHNFTQKTNQRDSLHLIDSLGDINGSMKIGNYGDNLNYSQAMTKSCTNNNNRYKKNIWETSEVKPKPYISEKSKIIANSKKTTNASVHDRLHQEALSKQKIKKRDRSNNSYSTEKRFNISDLNPTERKPRRKKKRKGRSMYSFYHDNLNHGHRLYRQGLKKLEDDEQKHREALALREREELNHSFHPKINSISCNIIEPNDTKPEDKLLMKGILARDKRDQKRAEIQYKKLTEFSFHPRINENSRKIIGERAKYFNDGCEIGLTSPYDLAPDQFHLLYEDAMKRVDRHINIYSK